MTLKVDKAGRIILPKPVRERHGLRPGTDVELSEGPDGLLLKPATQRPAMVRVKGFWVHQGVLPKGFDWSRFIEEQREERHDRLLRP